MTEIVPVAIELRHIIRNLKKWSKPRRVFPPVVFWLSKNRVIKRPKGNCLIIAPWNYPFLLTLSPLAAAIAAGNTVIVKPAERTPHTSKIIAELLSEIFPPEHVAVIEGGVEVSRQLLELPFDHIYFTGGTKIGKIVMEAASKHLTPVTLELGGKSPAVICNDADLDLTAKRLAWGKLINSGQTCISPDYVLVPENLKDELINKIKVYVQNNFAGSGSMPYCGLVDKRHTEKIDSIFQDALNKGAVPLYLHDSAEDGKFKPVLLTGVKNDMDVMKEEIFGPILPIITYNDLSEIGETVALNPNPLTFYIFGNDKRTIKYVENNIPAGNIVINGTLLHFANYKLPFGGIRQSGLGRGHGYAGFKEFSNEISVMKQSKFSLPALLFPPYTGVKKWLIEFTEKYL
ncbi:MAG: aldehyde dehydrogenase family protein [Ignavibacteria bacterium]|nr:MAG: aldehyde dehydrogenase family protein [Ignavibacteria bacterium]